MRDTLETKAFGLTSMLPESVPVLDDMNGPKTHHDLGFLQPPAHPCELQSVVDQVATCPFNDSAANRIALCQTDLVRNYMPVRPFRRSWGSLNGLGLLPLTRKSRK